MQKQDGIEHITFGWVATIIGLLLLMALLKTYDSTEEQRSSYALKCAQQYSEATEHNAKGHDVNWCDIAAQTSMARSAIWANRATWAGTIFAAISIFLVWRTLLESQRATFAAIKASESSSTANNQARDHFLSDQRPWLALNRPEVFAGDIDGIFHVYFQVKAENIGKTPAMQAELKLDFRFSQFPTRDNGAIKEFATKCAVPSTWENGERLIFQSREREFWEVSGDLLENAKTLNRHFVRILYCVSYRAHGFAQVLVTAGEVIFPLSRVKPRDPQDGLGTIEVYTHYGTDYAS